VHSPEDGSQPGSVQHPSPVDISGLDDEHLTQMYAASASPWVRLVMVVTQDGHTTGPSGSSRDISGPRDLDVMTLLRALSDAVVVGATTAIADGYSRISVRQSRRHLREGRLPEPRLCVMSRSGDIPRNSPMFKDGVRPIIVTTELGAQKLMSLDAEVIIVGERTMDLQVALSALHDRGITRISVEGGSTVARAFLDEGLIDEVDLTVSPVSTGHGPLFPPLDDTWNLSSHAIDHDWRFLRFVR
jgi:riboflavin-specific deaminase-like protein